MRPIQKTNRSPEISGNLKEESPPQKKARMTNAATEPATLNDLPAEMVCEVLRWLPLEDLVELKMTAKRYLQIVSDFKVKKLDVSNYERSDSHCWPALFIHQLARPTLSRLQQLTIEDFPEHFDLNQLNRFDRLVQLKITRLPEDEDIRLDLPELREFEVAFNETCKLRINSAKLEKLIYNGKNGGNLLQVDHPETVVYLDSDLSEEKLRSFRNLRHLRSSSNFYILDERTLSDFPDLKEIAYTGTYEDVNDILDEEFDGLNDLNYITRFLERFMARKKELDRTDLRVQFVSFELVDDKEIKDYKFEDFYMCLRFGAYNLYDPVDEIYLHAQNYDQLIGTFETYRVDYCQLMRIFDRIPDDFFSKFVGIWRVDAYDYEDEEHLLRFLQSVPNLREFEARAEIIGESFFDQLSESCSESLRSIVLTVEAKEILQNVNFPYLFPVLSKLHLEMDLSLEEFRWLLNMSWCGSFNVKFSLAGIEYCVTRRLWDSENDVFLCRNQIRLKSCSPTNLSELAEYFENM